MDNNTKHEAWVDTNYMLQHFDISRGKFEQLVAEGLPVLRIDGARRFKPTEVEHWLKQRQINKTNK